MRRHLAIALLATLFPWIALAAEGDSMIRFANGDYLTGSLDSFDNKQLSWASPILEKTTPFLLERVLDLTMVGELPDIDARHEASITLTNGDLVRGQLASVSDDAVELDTWYAGRMRFNRLMISDIQIAERPELVYRGPTGMDGWKHSGDKPVWTYRNGTLRSTGNGSIARDMNLPTESSVAFNVEWRNRITMRVVVFSEELSSDRPASGYELNIQSRSVSLRSGKDQRFIGQTSNVRMLQENEKARIEIRASTKTGIVALYIDGQAIENWTDTELAGSKFGQGVHFIASDSSPLRISRIEAGAWDGETEKIADPRFEMRNRMFGGGFDEEGEEEEEEQAETGRMLMRNGDSIAGEVTSIEDGKIRVKTEFREVRIPVESLRSVSLKPVDLERCIRKNGDVRAWFADGSSLVFRLDELGDETVSGFSQNFGTATFKLSAFNRIEFNIYSLELESIRLANGW